MYTPTQRQPNLRAMTLRFYARMKKEEGKKKVSEGGEWENKTSAVELSLPLDSTAPVQSNAK